MQFGSKSLSLEDCKKHPLGVATDNEAISVTQPRI
jgi:hypothetical protein